MRITRHESFEMGHVLDGYNGGCGNSHGHSYNIEVTVEGPRHQDHFGMVMDFNDLKKAIKAIVPDHHFAVNNTKTEGYEYDLWQVSKKHGKAIREYPCVTTAENMVCIMAEELDRYIKEEMGYTDVDVVEVKLWETANSHVTWIKGAMN